MAMKPKYENATTPRPDADEALYEVTVWNHTKQEVMHGILTTGRNLADAVDQAYAWVADEGLLDGTDDEIYMTVGRS